MPPSAPGICPLCESRGPIGRPCDQRPCQRRGYAFIPAEYMPAGHGAIDPEIGRIVGDHLLVGVVGGGGFGKVYLALQQPILMRTALKLMRAEVGDQIAGALERFESEAQAMAQLSHPNVVRLLRYGVHQGAPFLVMELVEGGRTLKSELARHAAAGRALDPGAVQDILDQLLNGLEAAHALGIVHRDLKPENLMLQAVPGHPNLLKILDFGLAKFTHEGTETSLALGTPSYMAPEQILRRHLGPWTDLYAVGAIAFELITGQRAFATENAQAIVVKKLDPSWDPVREAALPLPPRLRAVLSKALAHDPERRYRSAPELRDALREGLAELASAAPRRPTNPHRMPAAGPSPLDTPIARDPRPRGAKPVALADTVPEGSQAPAMPPADHEPLPTVMPSTPLGDERSARTRPRRAWLIVAALAGAGGVSAVVLASQGTPSTPTDRNPTTHATRPALEATPPPRVPDTLAAEPPDTTPLAEDTQVSPDTATAAIDTGPTERGTSLATTLRRLNPFVRIAAASHRVALGVDSADPRLAGVQTRTAFVPARGVFAPTRAYDLQSHEVTWEEYELYLEAQPDQAPIEAPAWLPTDVAARRRLPVTGVSWDDAMAYCALVARPLGGRLPTEEEWEWAARSGRYANDTALDLASRRLWPWGSAALREGDAELGAALAGKDPTSVRRPPLSDVMSHPRDHTPDGLWDLLGNAREWTADPWPRPGYDEPVEFKDHRAYRAIRGLELGVPPNPEGLAARARVRLCTREDCVAPAKAAQTLIGFRCARQIQD